MVLWLAACCLWPEPPALRFAVTGDVPYDRPGHTTELETLRRDVAAVRDVAFLAHLGDLKRGSLPCTPETYTSVVEAVCPAHVPVLVLPGDNEWNDCERSGGLDMIEAWRHWRAAFGAGADRCDPLVPPSAWQARPQVRPEQPWWPGTHTGAVRFDRDGVRVIGVALPSFTAKGHGLGGERGRKVRDLASGWVDEGLRDAPSEIEAAVVLVHADVLREDAKQEPFVAALREAARAFDRPVLVVTGDSHAFEEQRPFDDVDLTYVVVTRGGREAPLTVEVRPGAREVFRLVRGAPR